MPYTTPAALLGELGLPQAQVAWGVGTLPTEARTLAIIAANDAIIDGMCRGRYTVPFDPIPADIAGISVSLCLGDLLPTVHRNSAEQHARAREETRKAMALLDRIQAGKYSLVEGDDASKTATAGPVIVTTPPTHRVFSITDPH